VTRTIQTDNSDPNSIIVRIYGEGDGSIDRERELAIADVLSAANLIPQWYCIFGNGRMEEYIQSQTVPAEIFRSISSARQIVSKLSRIHCLLPEFLNIYAKCHPTQDYIFTKIDMLATSAQRSLQELIRKYEDIANSLEESSDSIKFEKLQFYKSRLALIHDILALDVHNKTVERKLLDRARATLSPLVLAHCDVHHGNILDVGINNNASSADFVIIDFEYALQTTRGYDLANFFCEFCSDYDANEYPPHEMDFSAFPSSIVRREVLGAYVDELMASASTAVNNIENVIKTDPQSDCMRNALDQIDEEILAYLPFVHYHWAHWGIVKENDISEHNLRNMYATSQKLTSFDYLKFAHLRYKQWNACAAEYIE
jgi:thiamine kinase-like enzyme